MSCWALHWRQGIMRLELGSTCVGHFGPWVASNPQVFFCCHAASFSHPDTNVCCSTCESNPQHSSVHAESWPQAMGIQAAPANVGKALALHYSLMDDIWHLCGDKSTDLSWCALSGMS